MHALKVWLKMATAPERELLAKLAGTKLSYLYFLSNPDKDYGRVASAELAGRIAAASDQVRSEGGPDAKRRLPRLLRTDLSPVCQGCAFARRCLGDAAIASEFSYEELPRPAG